MKADNRLSPCQATRGDQSSSSYSAHTGNRNRANDQKKIDPPKKKTPYESDAMRKEDAAHQKVMDLLNDERVRAESLRQQDADIREDAKTERVGIHKYHESYHTNVSTLGHDSQPAVSSAIYFLTK